MLAGVKVVGEDGAYSAVLVGFDEGQASEFRMPFSKATKAHGASPKEEQPKPDGKPLACPAGDHPIFVRSNGSIVAHYGADGKRCSASETTYTREGRREMKDHEAALWDYLMKEAAIKRAIELEARAKGKRQKR